MKEELRRMAVEAGVRFTNSGISPAYWRSMLPVTAEQLEAFARLVAEDCEHIALTQLRQCSSTRDSIANAIRAKYLTSAPDCG